MAGSWPFFWLGAGAFLEKPSGMAFTVIRRHTGGVWLASVLVPHRVCGIAHMHSA